MAGVECSAFATLLDDDDAMRGPLYANVYPIGCGHIDEMARFVAADTIALAEVSNPRVQNRAGLQ